MTAAALSGKDLSIGYLHGSRGKTTVAEHLELELRHGEVVCLVGPNGAGKSTLLRTLTGLQPRISGEIMVNGVNIDHLDAKNRARSIGVVLTERVNVGILPVFDLASLGRHPHTGWTGNLTLHDIEIVNWALRVVGADDLKQRNVNELSDGERQKVMIARALAQEPSIIVLDEPTAFLDLPRRVETIGLLKDLSRTTSRAILLSTHDLDLAIRAADRLWLMSSNGHIHTGAPEDLVLGGQLESVFAGEGIVFDQEHGSFHLAAEKKGYVNLVGHGQAKVWTERALRRKGFAVSTDPDISICTVAVNADPDGPVWEIIRAGKTHTCTTVYEMVKIVGEP